MMRTADCQNFKLWFEDLSDPRMDPAFRDALARHQANCDTCNDFAHRHRHQRRALRGLPSKSVPVNVAVNLRVLASKELARRAARVDWATRFANWRNHTLFLLSSLWRPFALPAAGGIASACFLFSALMPTFALQNMSPTDIATSDVPTAWYQSAEVYGLSPFGVNADNVTLDVQIDPSGRVVDYTVPAGDPAVWNKSPELRREVENSLLFMSFKPASFFGQPASDTIRITLRRSRIEVKG